MVSIVINGKSLEAEPGSMIIEAADKAGIRIPRFCYHKKLSIAANCRMCLVQVEKAPKALPACATPVTDGMVVHTQSKAALEAQRAVMEFLLINHPLDCPICDQGGECELQDIAMGYGQDLSRYGEGKRVVKDKDLGPLIATDMTRCIHCTRCVRFGQEIAGIREMGATGRGEHTEIGTYLEKNVDFEMSGNVIDLCPVGALTSKPFRFKSRTWELRQYPMISSHDLVGSNLFAHVGNGEVKRIVPKENEAVNEVWISDRDRYSYEANHHADRIQKPLVKNHQGQWQEVSWEDALPAAGQLLQRAIDTYGKDNVGGLISPNATTEEHYLFSKLLRSLNCQNIDHRLRQTDFSDDSDVISTLGMSLSEVESCDTIVIVGSHLRKEHPMLNHRVRKATLNGAKVIVLNPVHFQSNYKVAVDVAEHPELWFKTVLGLAHRAAEEHADLKTLGSALPKVQHQAFNEILEILKNAKKLCVFTGQFVEHHPQGAWLRHAASLISKAYQGHLAVLNLSGNSMGAKLARALPEQGKNTAQMIQDQLKAYFLFGVEAEDFTDASGFVNAIAGADVVVACAAFTSPALLQHADLILPIGTVFETSGTFVNIEGRAQSFNGVIPPVGEARPGWKVLRVLGNVLYMPGFDYNTSQEVLAEIDLTQFSSAEDVLATPASPLPALQNKMIRIAPVGLYDVDALTRRAAALQRTVDAKEARMAHLNSEDAKRLQLEEGDLIQIKHQLTTITLPVKINAGVATDSVMIYGAAQATHVGQGYESLTLVKGDHHV